MNVIRLSPVNVLSTLREFVLIVFILVYKPLELNISVKSDLSDCVSLLLILLLLLVVELHLIMQTLLSNMEPAK